MSRQPGVDIQTMDYPLSNQKTASTDTRDLGFSDLGDCEPLRAPKPTPRKEEGSLAAGPVGSENPAGGAPCLQL